MLTIKAKSWYFCVGILSLWMGLPAWGYSPPASFILETWVRKHQGSQLLRLKVQVVAKEGQFFDTVWYRPGSDRMLSVATDAQGVEILRFEKKKQELSSIGKFLFLSDVQLVAQALQIVEEVTLKRWENKIVWALTAPLGIEAWIEKDTFLPLRLLRAQDELSYQLGEMQMVGAFTFPKKITVVQRDQPLLSVQLVEFVQETVKSERSFTGIRTEVASSVKGVVQQYYELFR